MGWGSKRPGATTVGRLFNHSVRSPGCRGTKVPIVGNVAMDAVMVDVTDVPGTPVTVDDEFVLIGRQGDLEIRASDLASVRTTNSWEVVTSFAARLPRVFDAASGPQGLRTLVPDSGPRPRRTTA